MMTEETNKSSIDAIKDMFDGDFSLEITEDTAELDFKKPIKGKYICRIVGLSRNVGQSDKCISEFSPEGGFDFFALKLQVEVDAEGEKSGSRYMDKTYNVGIDKYSNDPDLGVKKLFVDLHTAGVLEGVTVTSTDKYEVAETLSDQIKDKLVNITAWIGSTGKQVVKVVNEHKLKGSKKDDSGSTEW